MSENRTPNTGKNNNTQSGSVQPRHNIEMRSLGENSHRQGTQQKAKYPNAAQPIHPQQERVAARRGYAASSGSAAQHPESARMQSGSRSAAVKPRQERILPGQRGENGEYAFQARQAERKKKYRMRRIMSLVALVVLVLSIFAIKLAVDLGGGANTFYEGVAVDGLKLNGYSREEAKEKLRELNTSRIGQMSVKLAYNGREFTILPEQFGVDLNLDEKLEEAWQLGRTGNVFARQKEINRLRKEGETLTTVLNYSESLLRTQLEEVKASVDLPATDATINFSPSSEEKFRITQESNGRSVDLDTLFTQVKNQLDNGFTSTIEIKPDIVSPTVFAEQLEKSTERIVRTTTDLGSSSSSRIHNVELALSYFNGMVLLPGQEVSFNQTTGPRGIDQGYENAGVIQDDEIIDGPGGGVCQVSTTLYQAVVKAGLEIIRSNKHSLPVSYVDAGTDAAVAYDYKDLIFKNNTEYPVFIEGRVSGKTVAISIYGHPLPEGTGIEIVTEIYEKIEPAETKTILDTKGEFVTYTDETKIKKKARKGIKVRSFRVYKENGEEVRRELLRDDYYKEVQGETYQGVTPRAGA